MNLDRAAHPDPSGRLRPGLFSAAFPSLPLVCFLYSFFLSLPIRRNFFFPAPTATGLASHLRRRRQARGSISLVGDSSDFGGPTAAGPSPRLAAPSVSFSSGCSAFAASLQLPSGSAQPTAISFAQRLADSSNSDQQQPTRTRRFPSLSFLSLLFPVFY
jgi:hypothetical protein